VRKCEVKTTTLWQGVKEWNGKNPTRTQMLRSETVDSGSEAGDEAVNGDDDDVEVMSEPPDPIDTAIFDPPVLCCGLAICQCVRLMGIAVVVVLGLAVVFLGGILLGGSSCGDISFVKNTSTAGEVAIASCLKLLSLKSDIS